MSPDEFKQIGYRLIDWIAEYRQRVEEWPVMAQVEPGFLRAQLPASPPERALGLSGIEAELERLVPGLVGWQSPNFFAYFPSNAPLHSVLADLVATGLGQIGLSWQAAPALTELEEVMNDWLRQMFGLPPGFRTPPPRARWWR